MIEKKYQRKPDRWWKGQRVVTVTELGNSNIRLTAGTVCTVERKYKGLSLRSDPCPACGVAIRISRVNYTDLAFLDEVIEA